MVHYLAPCKKATLTKNVKDRITQEDLWVKFPWYKNQVRTLLTIILKTLKFKSRCKLHKQMQKTIVKHYLLKRVRRPVQQRSSLGFYVESTDKQVGLHGNKFQEYNFDFL